MALRAVVQGKGVSIKRQVCDEGRLVCRRLRSSAARRRTWTARTCVATVYDRARLKAGNRIAGPAIVMEMDSTTVILPKHHGKVDAYGNILIYPDGYRAPTKGRRRQARVEGARARASDPQGRARRE